jgi:hypothetical protein
MVVETLAILSWRSYLVVLLMALGAVTALWGAKRGRKGLVGAVRGDSTQLIPLMEGFRALMIGLALIGVGIAWAWHLPWLLVVSLATGGGETFETSLILFALRHGAELDLGRPRTRPAPPLRPRRPPRRGSKRLALTRTEGVYVP